MVHIRSISASSLLLFTIVCGCSNGSATSNTIPPSPVQVAAPAISTKPAQAGAQIVSLTTSTAGATIRYTLDGSTPTTTSTVYLAPLLIATNVTLNAYATLAGDQDSAVTNRAFALKIASGTLVWSDEFTNPTGSIQQPDPAIWDYNTGNHGGYGNHELETYCAWASTAIPCDPTQPNVYVGTDGFLHIVARQPSKGVYTSARLKTQGRFSFQYGRLEARIRAPEAQGMWPAFWTLGNNVATVEWPACGEQDIMERVNGALNPDWNEGSIHGVGFTGDVGLGTKYFFPKGQTAAGWHTYGMIWKKGSVAYYVDDPAKPYVTYTNPESIAKFKDGIWPFDPGDSAFLILNLAVGGDWPKDPDATTPFPASLLVDYVRLYAN
jgi:beta-glucanase (GH16 family)